MLWRDIRQRAAIANKREFVVIRAAEQMAWTEGQDRPLYGKLLPLLAYPPPLSVLGKYRDIEHVVGSQRSRRRATAS